MRATRDATDAYRRARHRVERLLADRRAPLVLLAAVCALGVGARAFQLGLPAQKGPGQGYVFDEHYYVPAARLIAGDVHRGDVYATAAPAGADPNAEHPQLGKLIIAGGIAVFGDTAAGWRISAVIFGAAAILLVYWLVRCAGGGPWLALGAAALASADNLWIVSSRIAVLDVYVLPFMLAGVALYLRRRPLLAGAVIGAGGCVKEFSAFAVLVILCLEGMRALRARRARALLPAGAAALVAAVTYFSLLAVLDSAVTPYSGGRPVDRGQASVCADLWIWKGACNHFTFMNRYAAKLSNAHPRGIASHPWEFWINRHAITYYKETKQARAGGRVTATVTTVWFRGMITPVLLFTGWLALMLNVWWAIRRRDDLSFLVVAWTLGTWLPPAVSDVAAGRTTYLYYMVVVMPGVYMAVARLLSPRLCPRWVVAAWAALLIADSAALYPFRTLSGS
jgi:dolichyl-phosphate-mannose-protein mannosyltransferase